MAVLFIKAGTTSWTPPADWPGFGTVECIGAGADGLANSFNNSSRAGGGGGAYAKRNRVDLPRGAPVSCAIGGAGSMADTWFGTTTTVLAKPGLNGVNGGAGGQASQSVGDVVFSGGNGSQNSNNLGGGGGAAGPSGPGKNGGVGFSGVGAGGGGSNGGNSTNGGNATSSVAGAGGHGFSGTGGGRAGTSSDFNGGNGTNGAGGGGGLFSNSGFGGIPNGGNGSQQALWTSETGEVAGPGGGGGGAGARQSTPGNAGDGGGYGAGGGAGGNSSFGRGSPGLIVVTYTPGEPVAATPSTKIGTSALSLIRLGLMRTSAVYVGTVKVWADATIDPLPSPAVFFENFTAADGTSLEDMPGWTKVGGIGANGMVTIVNNTMKFSPGIGGGGDGALVCTDQGPGDCFVEAVNTLEGSANGFFIAMKVGDRDNFLGVRQRTSTYQVYTKIGGTFSLVMGSGSLRPTVGDVVRLELTGVDYSFHLNGVRMAGPTTLPQALRNSTRAGIIGRGDSLGSTCDDWKTGLK